MMVAGEEYIAVWSGLPEAQKGKTRDACVFPAERDINMMPASLAPHRGDLVYKWSSLGQ